MSNLCCIFGVSVLILTSIGCGTSSDFEVKNDLEAIHISIQGFCNNAKHYPEFLTLAEGKIVGWRPQVFSVAVPRPLSEGKSFFVDRSGKLFELNFPETFSQVTDLVEMPRSFVIGCQIDLPDGFDWSKPSRLNEIPSDETGIGSAIGVTGECFFLLLADGTVLKLKTDTPSRVLKPFFDEKEAEGASLDRLDTWRVD